MKVIGLLQDRGGQNQTQPAKDRGKQKGKSEKNYLIISNTHEQIQHVWSAQTTSNFFFQTYNYHPCHASL